MTEKKQMEFVIRLVQGEGKKVYIDPEGIEGIYLYPGEVRKKKLADGMRLSSDELEALRQEFALPRAKKRALGLLVKRDMTSRQLEEKLIASQHDSRSIREAMDFVIRSGYVDDMQYARDYLGSKRSKKSFRMIRAELSRKGISSEILDIIFEEEGRQKSSDVEDAVRKYARRFSQKDRAAAEKICAHFYRKGYDMDLIRGLVHDIRAESGEADLT